MLLVYRVDRFSRRIRDLALLREQLDASGVVFRPATEPFDTCTPVGRMLVHLLGVFAEFERDVIIDRHDGRSASLQREREQQPVASSLAPPVKLFLTTTAFLKARRSQIDARKR